MEISGLNHQINMNRVKGIVEAIPNYYPNLKFTVPEKEKVWHGLRPCSPDGLPYIGNVEHVNNLTIATGHAMMGLSLGPGTGKIVSELVSNKPPSMDLSQFNPLRFQ